jgi:hypothetical protein
VHQESSAAINPEPSPQTKRNWPLILTAAAVGLVAAAFVLGCVALWVTNFNLLDWME